MSRKTTTAPPRNGICVPRHVAVIMDGNGRWARQRGLPRRKGHEAGAESVRAIIRACRDHGVTFLTLYAFSLENWKRPQPEIRHLMSLLTRFLRSDEAELHKHRLRLRIIGRITDLPAAIRRELERVMADTRTYDKGQLILALSYGARAEIVDAAKALACKARTGELDPETIDEAMLARHLYAPDIPDPDLLIRTSGEMRISNFLLWQISYTELYVSDVMWPDFREPHFAEALRAYAARGRRFGGIEQAAKA